MRELMILHFKNYIEEQIGKIDVEDLHIDSDSIEEMRRKDMLFGKLVAFEDVLKYLNKI